MAEACFKAEALGILRHRTSFEAAASFKYLNMATGEQTHQQQGKVHCGLEV